MNSNLLESAYRWRKSGAGAAAAFLASVSIFALLRPVRYESTGVMKLPQWRRFPLLPETEPFQPAEIVGMETTPAELAYLQSRPFVRKAVERLGLPSADRIVLRARPIDYAAMVEIEAEAPDARTARDVVNAAMRLHLESVNSDESERRGRIVEKNAQALRDVLARESETSEALGRLSRENKGSDRFQEAESLAKNYGEFSMASEDIAGHIRAFDAEIGRKIHEFPISSTRDQERVFGAWDVKSKNLIETGKGEGGADPFLIHLESALGRVGPDRESAMMEIAALTRERAEATEKKRAADENMADALKRSGGLDETERRYFRLKARSLTLNLLAARLERERDLLLGGAAEFMEPGEILDGPEDGQNLNRAAIPSLAALGLSGGAALWLMTATALDVREKMKAGRGKGTR